jgi:hypothetical protein
MTQTASDETVVGNFNNGQLDYGGIHARMTRDHATHVIEFSTNAGSTRWNATVQRTVGSHRIQQYLARDGDTFFRLPVAWDVEGARWMHMNEAFLTPDPSTPAPNTSIARVDYDRHVTRWNDNCVFCHNVAPNPGLQHDGHFSTTTAELGIACEACHGPGGEHARVNRDPLRRYALHLSNTADPTIANPEHMSASRSSAVCGRCHGQRKATNIDHVLRDGDGFIPGTDLATHSTPLARDTTLNGVHGTFANRFWNDGTPRLTAYEYQGLLQSPCAVAGEMSCASCHAMHDSEPDKQVRSDLTDGDRRGGFETRPYNIQDNAQCTQCHTELADDQASSAHSHHPTASSGNRCIACHMPPVVYGLIGARISHRIETPDPATHAHEERPDACTLCHVTRTRTWASNVVARWHGDATTLEPNEATAPSEIAARLFGGDPIERALAAAALGREEDQSRGRAQRIAWLLNALAHDRYPAVRHIARRSLLALMTPHDEAATLRLREFNVTELSPEVRVRETVSIGALLGNPVSTPLSDARIATLRAGAVQRDIEIGE